MTPEQIAAFVATFWARLLSNGKSAAQDLVEIRGMLDGLDLEFWGLPTEAGNTAADLLRVIAAVQAGKSTIASTGPGMATVAFRAVDDSETRVTADMIGSERAAITLDVA